MNPRTIAREYSLQFLFHIDSAEFEILRNKDILTAKLMDFSTSYYEADKEQPNQIPTQDIQNFALQLIEGVIDNYKDLISQIENKLKNKKLKAINEIDLKILLVAIYEMKSTPKKIAINEAINLAKKYSTKDSYPFINSFLDQL